MGYVLTFVGGMMFGSVVSVISMCCFIVNGRESREEERIENG